MIYKCELEPFHDFVLVRMIDNPNRVTPGGIIIPETAEQQPVAQILAFGPGRDGSPSTVPYGKIEVGDLVVMQKYIGTKVDLNGHICMLVKWYDVQGRFRFVNDKGVEFKPEIPDDFFVKSDEDTKTTLS